MWEKEFDVKYLRKYNELIVLCDTNEDASNLMDELFCEGVVWVDGDSLDPSDPMWNEELDFTCYRIENGRMSRGSKSFYESRYDMTPKFTYHGVKSSFHDVTIEDVLGML